MFTKRLGIITLTLMVVLGFSISSFAHPPVGSFDETYYNGIWNIRFTETCHRASDGKVVPIALQNLYMRFIWDGTDTYDASLHPSLQDARDNTNLMGIGQFRFDPGFGFFFPIELPVSYVLSGFVERAIIGNADIAVCIDLVQAWLYTVVNGPSAGNKLYNKLTGTSIDLCSSSPLFDSIASVDDQTEWFECNDDWIAKWIEDLP